MIIGTATNGGWFSGLSKKVSKYIKVEPIDLTPGRVSVHNKYDFLNLDYKQMGVGGDDGWPKHPHPQYTLAMGKIKDVAKRVLPVIQ